MGGKEYSITSYRLYVVETALHIISLQTTGSDIHRLVIYQCSLVDNVYFMGAVCGRHMSMGSQL